MWYYTDVVARILPCHHSTEYHWTSIIGLKSDCKTSRSKWIGQNGKYHSSWVPYHRKSYHSLPYHGKLYQRVPNHGKLYPVKSWDKIAYMDTVIKAYHSTELRGPYTGKLCHGTAYSWTLIIVRHIMDRGVHQIRVYYSYRGVRLKLLWDMWGSMATVDHGYRILGSRTIVYRILVSGINGYQTMESHIH